MLNKNSNNLSNTLICNLEQVARICRLSACHFFEKNKNIDIKFNDFLIIETLHLNPKIHQRYLAKILSKDTANLSRDLEKLEKRGLIERFIEIKENRTVKSIVLSKEGEKLYQEVSKHALNHINKIEEVFSKEEKELFLNYIERLKARINDTISPFNE